jgi:asparagine synthase (glutamine-hydrolysing)
MCGIFALLNNGIIFHDAVFTETFIREQFMKGVARGPEFSRLLTDSELKNMFLGFHRLAINGLNSKSNQPFFINGVVLVCNGEIYNYKQLYELMHVKPETDSDCEVIVHMYLKYGIEQTLTMLDGVFSFVLYDSNNNKLFVARDPYGVRPLYYMYNKSRSSLVYGFASELKCLSEFHVKNNAMHIEQFTPGTYTEFDMTTSPEPTWVLKKSNVYYFIPTFSHTYDRVNQKSQEENTRDIRDSLIRAVHKRCLTTDRPIACLLSGGLDSSLITALVNEFYSIYHIKQPLETYSIGLKNSEDLKYARIVADYLGTKHTEIILTEEDFMNAIPEVIYAIESYDTTTVRASIGNYLLGKYISNHSNAKVIFNGDGSDEIAGGYLYMKKCPDSIEFDKETRRLLKDIHLFDVLRSDKSISSHGLEPRTPFLDKNFVNTYLSIPPEVRYRTNITHCEKYLIRESFSDSNYLNSRGKQILPNEILWRTKEAFSDGVSGHGRSLFQILQEQIADKLNSVDPTIKYDANINTEKIYYSTLFNKYYPGMNGILPYFWMPKYTNASDPSARTLDVYHEGKDKAL